ncbi:hypothetical protein [Streptomyces sp. NPDC049906]|uniref:hypothetical protein n=1 Tax=Streptomyces sp. NPDC049906 TaxID=3155656 RepID=UPI0034178170
MRSNVSSLKEDPTPRPVTITPELAEDLLSRTAVNRRLDMGVVDFLAETIRRGEWQLTHQGIALDGPLESGSLVDGQHRLYAIIKADTAVRIFVFEGLSRSAFSVLDTGKRRSGADALSQTGEKYVTLFSSTIRHVILFKTVPELPWSGIRARVTNDRTLKEYNANTERYRDSIAVGRNLSKQIFTTPTAAAAGYFLTTEAAPFAPVEEWIDGLVSGANLKAGDPRLALLKVPRDPRRRGTKKRFDSKEQMAIYIKAWNSWVENEAVVNLRLKKGEKMPIPIELKRANGTSERRSEI